MIFEQEPKTSAERQELFTAIENAVALSKLPGPRAPIRVPIFAEEQQIPYLDRSPYVNIGFGHQPESKPQIAS